MSDPKTHPMPNSGEKPPRTEPSVSPQAPPPPKPAPGPTPDSGEKNPRSTP